MKTFYVLHNVADNTYSSHVIRADRFVDLYDFFNERPQWYNRSTFKCTFTNAHKPGHQHVTVVYFKHAVPLETIHMVSRKNTSVNVQKLLKCVHRAQQLTGGEAYNYKNAMKETAAIVGATAGIIAAKAGYDWYQRRVILNLNKQEREAYNKGITDAAKTIQKLQTELNDTCFETVKRRFTEESLLATQNMLQIRNSCTISIQGTQLTKGDPIGKGTFGIVYAIHEDDTKVIKEQTGFCYLFFNEFVCLQKLNDSGITPKIYDAYVCLPHNKTINDVSQSDVIYGYVMEKFDLTLLDFLKNEANKDVDGYANQILTILKVLTRYKILHRDFLASNFMVNNQGTIKIIDFGLAYDRDTPSSKTQYNAPLLTEELNQYTNINLFISQLGHEIKVSKTARIFLQQDDPFKSILNIVLPKLQNILEFVKNHNT